MSVIPEVQLEEDQQIEVGLQKINTMVKNLHVKITEIEAQVMLSTPPEA